VTTTDHVRVFERSAVISAPAADVWERVVSPDGINNEMRPWMTMSMPRSARGMTVDTVPLNVVLGRAWIRLFGLIPIDYDALSIVELEPGRYFHEKSTMASMRRWEHERTLAALDDGSTRVTDRITFEPRVPGIGAILGRVLAAFFGHRHRRLARHFGR
jgi:ligand-binding SRPBCC domain-containing protein